MIGAFRREHGHGRFRHVRPSLPDLVGLMDLMDRRSSSLSRLTATDRRSSSPGRRISWRPVRRSFSVRTGV
ncbi:hypothetical protein SSCG_03881 [Streptomyces clavuligerus]|nr:hypothetical protein SSCG_03881 [Streptomyces clavuligerus]